MVLAVNIKNDLTIIIPKSWPPHGDLRKIEILKTLNKRDDGV